MPEQFRKADEAAEIARDVIDEYHQHLSGVRIEYLFSDASKESKGRRVYATAQKIGGKAAALAKSESDDEPLTWVCNYCCLWRPSDQQSSVTANDDTYVVCVSCLTDHPELHDKIPNRLIKRLVDGVDTAAEKEAAGPPLNRDFFLITIYEPWWKLMGPESRIALIDHELCHCGLNDELQLTMLPHGVVFGNLASRLSLTLAKKHRWPFSSLMMRLYQPFTILLKRPFGVAVQNSLLLPPSAARFARAGSSRAAPRRFLMRTS